MINFSLYVFCQNKKKRKLDRREEYKGLSTSVQSDLLPKPEFICVKTLSLILVKYLGVLLLTHCKPMFSLYKTAKLSSKVTVPFCIPTSSE